MRSSRMLRSFGWAVVGSLMTMVLMLAVQWGPWFTSTSGDCCVVHVDNLPVDDPNEDVLITQPRTVYDISEKVIHVEETSEIKKTVLSSGLDMNALPPKYQPERWKNHTRTVCRALGMSTDATRLKDHGIEGNVVIDDEHELLLCQVAKVASTYLGKVFAILTGKFNGTDPNAIPSRDVHSKYNSMLIHFQHLSFEQALLTLENYFTFTIVRDPFERLLSAYRNKFFPKPNPSFTYLSRKIISVYRKNHTDTSELTFPEFVEYLADTDGKIPSNGHWKPYYQLCRPCEMNYAFIGKLESFAQDLQYVAQFNNLTELVQLPKPDSSSEGHSLHKTDKYLKEFYSQVPKESLKKLYKVYYPDYAIYNYTVPRVIKDMLESE